LLAFNDGHLFPIGLFAFLSTTIVKDAIVALPGIELTTAPIELLYNGKTYLDNFDPIISVSTNIYIFIVPDATTLQNVISQCQISGGFFVGPKAFFYFNVASTVNNIPQGGLILTQTAGTYANASDFSVSQLGGAVALKGSANAFDSVVAVGRAIKRLRDASTAVIPANVLTELENTDEHGYSGPLAFNAARYRSIQTYNVSNVALTTPVRTVRSVFTWNGALTSTFPTINFPGPTTIPTPGNVTLWPVGFISSMFDSYASMIGNNTIVPLNVTAHRSFVRYAVKRVNDLIMPIDSKISTPPLNDNGTINGAVRIASTVASDTYVAMVATWDSSNSKIIQGILSAYDVPQLSYSASDPSLSNKQIYPTLLRVNPSDAKQAMAMISMIQSFKWTQVGVLSSTSSYSQVLDSVFTTEIKNWPDISQGTSATFTEDGSNIVTQLQTLKDNRINILVVLADSSYYVRIMAAMKSIDYKPRAVIVPDRFFTPLLWQHTLPSDESITMTDFKGWIGVVPAGGFELAQFANLTTDVMAQSSQTYPSMKEGFAQSPDYCAFIADAFMVIGDTINRIVRDGKDPRLGLIFMEYLRTADLSLTTGRVNFDDNLDRAENRYVAKYLASNGNAVVFGTWNDIGATTNFASRASVVWPDGTTDVPIAVDPRTTRWLSWKSAAGIVLAAVAGCGLLLIGVMILLMVMWRESPILISATYPFLVLILLGAGLGFGSMFTWIGEPTDWICALRIWLPPMALVIMLTPLLAKTWRLHRIFTLSTLKRTPIPLWKLIVMVSCLSLIQVAICIAWISAGTIKPVIIDDKQNVTRAYKICAQNNVNRICAYVTYGYLGLLMLIGAYYAFRVRNLPKDFNESRWIGFSIYNTLLFSIIIVILGYSLTDFKVTVLILICVCTLAITFGVVGLMMAPKLWDLVLHPDRRTSGSGSTLNNSGGSMHTPRGSKKHQGNSSFRSESGGSTSRRHDYSRKASATNNSAEMKNVSKDRSGRAYSDAHAMPTEPRNAKSKKPVVDEDTTSDE
jgi:ABC-type branched-subunit amino acid transport system substrate-binding protein